MIRIDLTLDTDALVLQLAPLVKGAQFVGLLSPADEERGYIVTDDESFPRAIELDDIVVTAFRANLNDVEFAQLVVDRLMEFV